MRRSQKTIHRLWCILIVIFNLQIQFSTVEAQYFQLNDYDSCHTAMIPCGGHTQGTCNNYCTTSGYSKGMCDGSCCFCIQGTPSAVDISSSFAFPFGNVIFPSMTNTRNGVTASPNPPRSRNPFGQSSGDTLLQNNFRSLEDNLVEKNNSRRSHVPYSGKDVCTSSICQMEAQSLKSKMDERVDPCDDFYEFACGGFIRGNGIARDQVEVTQFSILRDKVNGQLRSLFEEKITSTDPKPFVLLKNFYKSCMNTDTIERIGFSTLIEPLKDIGGWPVLQGERWKPTSEFRWENFCVWFKELGFSMDYFVRIAVEPDSRDSQRKNIVVAEPRLSLGEQIIRRGLNEPVVNSYYNFMTEMAILMGADPALAKEEMLKVVNLEVSMAQCFQDADSRAGKFYYPMTIQDLSQKFPAVPWLQMFQRIVSSSVKITNEENIMVAAPYLECFSNLIAQTEQRTLANYAIWRAVSGSASFLHEAARKIQMNFLSGVTGQKQRQPRWKECTEITSSHLVNAAGALYIRRYFPESSKRYATEMVSDIQRAFLDILYEADWMDASTKMQAIDKGNAIQMHVAYPEEHKMDAKLAPIYAKFDFKDNDYFGNVRNLIIGSTSDSFADLKRPVQKGGWASHGKNAVVNAFYMPLENSIQLPAAILQGHFFDASRPKYLNYGSIGWIIGQEISHGFDDMGHQFDKNGNHKNWWDDQTKKTFQRKKQCVIDQYNSFQSLGLRVNGERTQGENIADNGGIKQAYRGYQYWLQRNGGEEKGLPGLAYSPQQLFWISAAQNWCAVQRSESLKHIILTDEHAPPETRVRGTFSNNLDFSKDFQCSLGKRMNPRKKCFVW